MSAVLEWWYYTLRFTLEAREKGKHPCPCSPKHMTKHVWGETEASVYWRRMPGDSDSGGRFTSEFSVLTQCNGSVFYLLAKPDQKTNGIFVRPWWIEWEVFYLPNSGSELKEYPLDHFVSRCWYCRGLPRSSRSINSFRKGVIAVHYASEGLILI